MRIAIQKPAKLAVSVRGDRDPSEGLSFFRVELHRPGASWLSQKIFDRQAADIAAACLAQYLQADLRL